MKNEIRKIINRKEFYFTFWVLFLAVIAEYIYTCYMFREVELSKVVSAYDVTMLNNISMTPFSAVYGLLLPVLVSVLASTIAFEEKKNNMIGCCYTRISKKKYIKNQGMAVFSVAFLIVLVCLLVSLLLAIVTYPIQGNFSLDFIDYERFLFAYEENLNFERLFRLHPYVNILVFTLIRALFAGGFALFSYGISFLVNNKLMIILMPLVFTFVQELGLVVLVKLGGEFVSTSVMRTGILSMCPYGNVVVIGIIWLILMLIGAIGINRGIKVRDEL